MIRQPRPGAWTVLSGTQIGSVHIRDGRPIQDAVRTWTEGDAAVVAVADGHGHHDHFRSDVGAQVAVDAAVEALVAALGDLTEPAAAAGAVVDVATRVVETWTAGVRQHAVDTPFEAGRPADPLRPYGTTLLAMAVVGTTLSLFQIGDGDTIVVDSSGGASRPLPEDPDADGVSTASLCQPHPLKSLRSAALDLGQRDVVLAFQCTDGFGSSRVDAAGWWRQTGEELVRFGRERGYGWVAEQLPGWLEEPAQVGGDDTTLALIGRTDLGGRAVPTQPA
jgi:Protein phosphatase 2C